MTPARRFRLGLIVVATAVGVIRATTVTWLFHLSMEGAVRNAVGQVALASVWIPIGLIALWIFESRLSRVMRAFAIVVVAIGILCVEPTLVPILGVQGSHPPPYWTRFINRSDTSLLFYFAVVVAAAAVVTRTRQLATELAAAQLEVAVADAKLHILTLQLHPHFLFNALNLVSQLAYENIDAARATIANIRALLLESLRHSLRREVPLVEEMRFVEAYLEIQEARFRGRLFHAVTIADGAEEAAVPHLLLQPLVENAIVHGLSARSDAGHLDIAARRVDSRLVLAIRDDGNGMRGTLREGLGLGNARLRLEQLFGCDYLLELVAAPDRGVIVTVDIPFRRVDPHAEAKREDVFADASLAVADESRSVHAKPRVSPWLPTVAAWIGIAILWSELRVLGQPSSRELGLTTIVASHALSVGLWMALTPLVLRFARWAALSGPRSKRFVIAHACGAIIAGVGHTALWIAALYAVGSGDLWPTIRSMFGWMIWDAGAYAAIVSVETFIALSTRIRDARVSMIRKRARLAEARLAALRLRLQPRILVGALDALERVVSVDAERAEAAIARMGDLLRLLLTRADDEWVDVDDEIELLMAYLDVVVAGRSNDERQRPAVIVECGAERIPAMLLLTAAASIGGAPDDLSIRRLDDVIVLDASVRDDSLDEGAVAELSQRLAELYRGNERMVSGRDANGDHFIHIEIPASKRASVDFASAYGFASA